MLETHYEHIILLEKNVPIIAGTDVKVSELVLEHIAYDLSAEELKYRHQYLTLGKICSALAYYWDHQEEIDTYIEQHFQGVDQILVDQLRRTAGPPTLKERLRTRGLI